MTALRPPTPPRRGRFVVGATVVLVLVLGAMAAWLGWRGMQARDELSAAQKLIPTLRDQASDGDVAAARETLQKLRTHTGKSRELTGDPVWAVAAKTPILGDDVATVTDLAEAVDDLAVKVGEPLVAAAEGISPDSLRPRHGRLDLAVFKGASSSVTAANAALAEVTAGVDETRNRDVVGQLATARGELLDQLGEARGLLDPLDKALRLMPGMLGADGPRNYLVLFQNNAEIRATGGMPGAFAIVKADRGAISMVSQGAPGDLGRFTEPTSPLPQGMERMFGDDPGVFFQDVNFTPNWPWAASRAREMYLSRKGGRIDGVAATDPIALSYLMSDDATLQVGDKRVAKNNLVPFLLHQVYLDYAGKPVEQNELFADVAKGAFGLVTSGDADARALLTGLRKGADEGRVLLWSTREEEQSVLATTALTGPLRPAGTGGDPASASADSPVVGVFFNGAIPSKMDFFLRQKVELGAPSCSVGGQERSSLRVTLTSAAPAGADTVLPLDVVGPADYVKRGQNRVQVLVYLPRDAGMGRLLQDGKPVRYGSGMDAGRRTLLTVVTLDPGKPVTLDLEVDLPAGAIPVIRTTPTVLGGESAVRGRDDTPNGSSPRESSPSCK